MDKRLFPTFYQMIALTITFSVLLYHAVSDVHLPSVLQNILQPTELTFLLLLKCSWFYFSPYFEAFSKLQNTLIRDQILYKGGCKNAWKLHEKIKRIRK